MGGYGGPNYEENGSFIYNSTDGINWDICYNASEYGWDARHIHQVKVDPLTDYIYASQGDNNPRARTIRSIDKGQTWTSIWNGSVWTQPTVMEFYNNLRIFGTDGDRIYTTSDDINIEHNYTLPNLNRDYMWISNKDSITGYYLIGTVSVDTGSSPALIVSSDGVNWFGVEELGATGYTYKGYRGISNFDELGFSFIQDNVNNKTYKINFNVPSDYSSNIRINLNENSGTTAHDTSGNSNDGTITGSTWNNDGILVTLTAITDYTIDTTTGLFTITNDDYSWAWMNASWDYETVTDRNLPANTILRLIEVFIGILFIAIAWLYIKEKLL